VESVKSFFGAWEWNRATVAIDFFVEREINAETLSEAHDVGPRNKTNDDVRSDFGEGPGFAC